MSKCIIIPHDLDHPLARTELSSLHDYQMAVGGYVQSIALRDPAMAIYCDEDGKDKGRPMNRRATALWWLFEPAARGMDIVVGDVALVGPADRIGHTADVPENLATLLIDVTKFKVQVSSGGDWIDSASRFDDFFYATMFAMRILKHTGFEVNVRVVAV
jgi:hypothetical protein